MINDNEWAYKDSDDYHYNFANKLFNIQTIVKFTVWIFEKEKIVPVTNMQGPSHIWELKVAQVSSVKSWDELLCYVLYANCHKKRQQKTIQTYSCWAR